MSTSRAAADIGEPVLGGTTTAPHLPLHLASQCDGPWVPGPGPGVRLSALEARQEGRVPEGWGLEPWLLGPLCGVSCHPDGQPSEVTAKDEAKEPGKEWDLASI